MSSHYRYNYAEYTKPTDYNELCRAVAHRLIVGNRDADYMVCVPTNGMDRKSCVTDEPKGYLHYVVKRRDGSQSPVGRMDEAHPQKQ